MNEEEEEGKDEEDRKKGDKIWNIIFFCMWKSWPVEYTTVFLKSYIEVTD